jgi:hypothetical protein
MSSVRNERANAAEYGLVFAWFAVSLLIVGVFGFFASSARGKLVAKSVNAVLERAGDKRRLSAPASNWGIEGRAAATNLRFTLEKANGGAVVFTVNGGGEVATCVALVGDQGTVERVLPLDAGSAAALDRLPAGLLRAYTARIEAGERMVRSKENP